MAIAKPVFDKLTPAQQAELRAATQEAIDIQIGKSAKDEFDALETFKAAKLRIVEPDVAAFRTAVREQYRKSGMSDKWKPGLMERVDAVR